MPVPVRIGRSSDARTVTLPLRWLHGAVPVRVQLASNQGPTRHPARAHVTVVTSVILVAILLAGVLSVALPGSAPQFGRSAPVAGVLSSTTPASSPRSQDGSPAPGSILATTTPTATSQTLSPRSGKAFGPSPPPNGERSTASTVDPYDCYSSEPARMGIADYGVNGTSFSPFQYLTNSFIGTVAISSLATSGPNEGTWCAVSTDLRGGLRRITSRWMPADIRG